MKIELKIMKIKMNIQIGSCSSIENPEVGSFRGWKNPKNVPKQT